MIQVRDVTFAYPGAMDGTRALAGVSVELHPGEVLAVAGANGSGKSTLARLCDGLLVPSAGSVLVDGLDTRDETHVWDIRSRVGMVFQDPEDQIVGTIVEEDVAFGPENLGVGSAEIRHRVTDALAAVGLSGFERREPHLLSEGQKHRVAIAGALALRPAYLVLDEPTAMLDPAGRRGVLDLIDRLTSDVGIGVLHVTHDAASLARADRVLVLESGGVAYSGPPDGLLADDGLLSVAGLEAPPMAALVRALRERGLAVPARVFEPERLASVLWP